MKLKKEVVPALLIATFLLTALAATVKAQEVTTTFQMSDPENDDDGPGTYTYPRSDQIPRNCHDMRNFIAGYNDNDKAVFKVMLENTGGFPNPWNGNWGFSPHAIHIYIDNGSPSGRNDTRELNLKTEQNFTWNWAVIIHPFSGQGPGVLEGLENVPMEQLEANKKFPPEMTFYPEKENIIVAEVPTNLIGEPKNDWRYVVTSTSFDGYGPGFIRAFSNKAEKWVCGGADNKAILKGVHPRVFDVLAPTAKAQHDMLSTWSAEGENGTFATVKAYPKAEAGGGISIWMIIGGAVAVIAIVVAYITRWRGSEPETTETEE